MRERSIAEIIGFESKVVEIFCVDGVQIDRYSEPTVDDMLAWLKAQDRAPHISGSHPHHQWQVRVSRPGEYEAWVPFSKSHNAPTLHAALEAAVRSVAEAKP